MPRPWLCRIGVHRWRYFRHDLMNAQWRRCTRTGCDATGVVYHEEHPTKEKRVK